MDIHTLFAALRPELHKVTLKNGAELYVHRPAINNFEKSTDAKRNLLFFLINKKKYQMKMVYPFSLIKTKMGKLMLITLML